MAEDFNQAKTEAPTDRRRTEARDQGQVAVSVELTGSVLLLVGVLALMAGSSAIALAMRDTARYGMLHCYLADVTVEQAQEVLRGLITRGAQLTAPFLALLFVIGLGTMVAQVGFHPVPELISLKWERLDPVAGLQRLFSVAGAVRGSLALAKVAVLTILAYLVVRGRMHELLTLQQQGLGTAVATTWTIALRLSVAGAAAMVLLGLVDYGYQRFRLEQSLRMSREELKEEVKREEGDPKVKQRIRRMARELSRRKMLRDVPRATVVITNPTHLAIALRYDRTTMAAPKVVAKGAGYVAQRIVELARRHSVPVVERRPVAQALYGGVKIGQEIPTALYHAVAEILALVLRLRNAA